ncbi:mechanosensitive ion channel family protein [Malonomonas rubra]|uniref:mechanosensitive ion channel family protein n=1 Tax=Malonomonas rubra TaxID=57040 RepID=UPI0026EA0384|nr:mechanosensitive ion channel domain-containing protein [Malonomonas rubra]
MWQIAIVGGAFLIGFLLDRLVSRALKKIIYRQENLDKFKIRQRYRVPLILLLPTLAIFVALPAFDIPSELFPIAKRLLSISFIILFTWLATSFTLTGRDFILTRYDTTVSDNLKARAIHTQLNILVKIFLIIIGVVASASIIMMFDNIRQLGTSLIASAGVVGIIIGFAAQRSIATLLAGLQIAMTQPVRIDDVVIVEGEWGRIEEITLTYIVVRIWDLRRLVVPTSYFLEKPFQNWTRISADLLPTVTLHADYSLPVAAVREQLQEILQESPYWDGQLCKLHVTDATKQTVELRALMSAKNSSAAWELRCEVREKLLDFLQQQYPQHLPKIRAELIPEGSP